MVKLNRSRSVGLNGRRDVMLAVETTYMNGLRSLIPLAGARGGVSFEVQDVYLARDSCRI